MDQSHTNQSTPPILGSFQQPFLPQDLWNMPMTFEWDLALFDDPHKGAGQGQSFQQHQFQWRGFINGYWLNLYNCSILI